MVISTRGTTYLPALLMRRGHANISASALDTKVPVPGSPALQDKSVAAVPVPWISNMPGRSCLESDQGRSRQIATLKQRAYVVPANTSPLPVLGYSFFPDGPPQSSARYLYSVWAASMLCIRRVCRYLIRQGSSVLRWFVRYSPPSRVQDTLVVLEQLSIISSQGICCCLLLSPIS